MTNQMITSPFETDIIQVSNGGTHALRESQQWDDLYMRHNFDDTGMYPTSGSLSASPDIIPAGLSPYADPSQLIADTNWVKDFGSSADSEIPNYIYLRGRNLGGAQTEGKIYLYAAKASLLNYPTLPKNAGWSQNPLTTQKKAEYVTVKPGPAQRFVTPEPFQWIPGTISGDHYCLVGRVVTAAHPNPIPTTGNLNDFAGFISTHPNMSWRNISLRDPGMVVWNDDTDYYQGDIGGDVIALLKCENCPVGSDVAMTGSAPGTSPAFVIPRTRIDANTIKDGVPTWTKSLLVNIPANWSSGVTFTWWSNNLAPLPDLKVSLEVIMPQPSADWDPALERFAQPLEDFGVMLGDHVGPTKGIRLGSNTMAGLRPPAPMTAGAVRGAAMASFNLAGFAWQETSSSVLEQSVTPYAVAINRAIDKNGVENDVLMLTGRPTAIGVNADGDVSADAALSTGPDAGDTLVLLAAYNVPAGCEIWFNNRDGDVRISVPPTTVKLPSPFTVSTIIDLPEDYQATVSMFLRLNGKVLPPDWSLKLSAIRPVIGPDGLPQIPEDLEDAGPIPGKLLGSVTVKR